MKFLFEEGPKRYDYNVDNLLTMFNEYKEDPNKLIFYLRSENHSIKDLAEFVLENRNIESRKELLEKCYISICNKVYL